MGGHNRPYPSLGWMGVDGEQIVWKNGLCDAQSGAGSLCRIPVGELRSPAYAGLALVMSCAGPGDLTPRRGLVYDAAPIQILSCTQRRRNATWQVMY